MVQCGIGDACTNVPLFEPVSKEHSSSMSVNQALLRLGLVIYAFSFFLIATGDRKGPTGRLTGYECAYLAVESAITDIPFTNSAVYAPPFGKVQNLVLYLSILISGLINPVFLVYATLAFLNRKVRVRRVLKFALLSMIPFCWVVFHFLEVYPREGHALWVSGMLLVLVSRDTQTLPAKAEGV